MPEAPARDDRCSSPAGATPDYAIAIAIGLERLHARLGAIVMPSRCGGTPCSCRRPSRDPTSDGPTLLNGWDTLTFAALAAGVRAVVWGAASIVPEQCVELHRLLIDDIDLPAARELWARLWPLCQFLEDQSYPAAVKTACRLAGDSTGPVRAPLLPLDGGATNELAALLENATLAQAAR